MRKTIERQSIKNTWTSMRYVIHIIAITDIRFFVLKAIVAIINAVAPMAAIIIPGMIINELCGEQRYNIAITWVLFLAAISVLIYILNSILSWILQKVIFKLRQTFKVMFYNHISDMDYESLESPSIQMTQERASQTLENFLVIVDSMFDLISAFFLLVGTAYIIVSQNWFILLLVVVVILINSIITKRVNQKQFETNKINSKYVRGCYSNSFMLTARSFGMENRLFDVKSLLIEKYKYYDNQSFQITRKLSGFSLITGFISSIIGNVQTIVIYIYLIMRVIFNNMPIGDLTICMNSVNSISNSLQRIVLCYLKMSKDALNVQELKAFMNIPLKKHVGGLTVPESLDSSTIEFRNVSFKYPGCENYSIKNLSVKIICKEKLCIVGLNGSGKSTFIKLLLRLYDCTEGEILLNGINIKEYNYYGYQKLFSPVFQDYVMYHMSMKENIILTKDYDEDLFKDVVKKTGVEHISEKLPNKYNTHLAKMIEDDGINPSGGEGQKIAIARALYHKRKMFILDEPTASLDPMAEFEIYKQFHEITDKSGAIIITHRLSAVQLADTIAVFKNGTIIEYGKHAELYARGGVYTEMFDKQGRFYIENHIFEE